MIRLYVFFKMGIYSPPLSCSCSWMSRDWPNVQGKCKPPISSRHTYNKSLQHNVLKSEFLISRLVWFTVTWSRKTFCWTIRCTFSSPILGQPSSSKKNTTSLTSPTTGPPAGNLTNNRHASSLQKTIPVKRNPTQRKAPLLPSHKPWKTPTSQVRNGKKTTGERTEDNFSYKVYGVNVATSVKESLQRGH